MTPIQKFNRQLAVITTANSGGSGVDWGRFNGIVAFVATIASSGTATGSGGSC